jgi:hypothetical protein
MNGLGFLDSWGRMLIIRRRRGMMGERKSLLGLRWRGFERGLRDEYKDETMNKPVYVYSAAMSEKRIAGIVTRLSGIEFQGAEASIEEITRMAFEDDKGDGSHDFNFYTPFCFGEGYGGDFRYLSWNEKLGLKKMSEGEVEGFVKGWLEEMGGEKVGAF